MAPSNSAAKARKGNGQLKVPPRAVVPAIPLPMTRRTASAPNQTASTTRTAATAPASTPATEKSAETIEATPETPSTADTAAKLDDAMTPRMNGEAKPATTSAPVIVANSQAKSSESPVKPDENPAPEPFQDQLQVDRGGMLSPESMQGKDATPSSKSSGPRHPAPMISPTRYQMPPPFQPGHRLPAGSSAGDAARISRPPIINGPPHMHHPHPSNGSLQFGGLHDSNSSSPAPPHSGGIAPPPGHNYPIHSHVNGYPPPMMPYGTEFVPASDGYGRPLLAMAPMDQGYPPYMNTFGPSTPHSFQGSQSSAQPDEAGPMGPYTAGSAPNGTAGQPDDIRAHQRGFSVPQARMVPNPMPPPHLMHQALDSVAADGLSRYMQGQFADQTFSDCTLELRYSDDRAAPVRIPAHRLILARSQTLQAILQSNTPESSPHGLGQRTVLLQSDDKYLRSDAFWMAVQRLYGMPLLEIPPNAASMAEGGELTLAGTATDRFDFALGYVAAGHLLRWESVVIRGMEIAAQLLSWSTIEKTLEFALGDMPSRGTADSHSQFTYGPHIQILLNGAIAFIINNFPANFSLDTSVIDSEKYSRLPTVPSPPPPPTPSHNAPAIARGTSVHLGPGRRPRLSHIKFGDISPSGTASEGTHGPLSEAMNISAQPRLAWHATLSRVLLNLPFAFVKPVLESGGHGNVSAWANAEARHRVTRDVVVEREVRRIRALDAVKSGRIAQAAEIQRLLKSPEPALGNHWDVLGWQEEVVPFGNADAPSLVQKWTPLAGVSNGDATAPLTPRTPEYP